MSEIEGFLLIAGLEFVALVGVAIYVLLRVR
jgi:hypothetical protein